MLRLYQRLKEDVKKCGLREIDLEDIYSAQGRCNYVRPLAAKFGGSVSDPEINIDFDWINGAPNELGVKKWSMIFDNKKSEEYWSRGLVLDFGDHKARINWGWGNVSVIPDGHGPGFIYKGSSLNFDHPEEKADWLLKLAITLDLGDSKVWPEDDWTQYYERFRPKENEVVYNWQKYSSDIVARWAVLLDKIGVHYNYNGVHKYDLGDGVWGACDFEISAWKLDIGISEGPPSDEQQEIARRLTKTSLRRVLLTFGECNSDGWLFQFGERIGESCRILDCRSCERVVLERFERGRDTDQWNWSSLSVDDWCNKENCIGRMRELDWVSDLGWAGKLIKTFNPSPEPSYESQKPGLYKKVKAAQETAAHERFRIASDPIVSFEKKSQEGDFGF